MAAQSPHLLLQILAKLEKLRNPDKQGQGNRHYFRWIARGDAELYSEDERFDGPPMRVYIRDISWNGLGFICDHPLPTHSLWRIHFLTHDHVVGHQSTIVRHCRQVDENVYLVGTQFVIDAGLMCMLGVDPSTHQAGDGPTGLSASSFQSPAEVA